MVLLSYTEAMSNQTDAVILISADVEWQAVRERLGDVSFSGTPYGEMAMIKTRSGDRERQLVFLQGGWGKIAAAASTQYAIDRFQPALVVNLGTCGGFAPDVDAGTVLLVDYTLVYDILEQMGDADEALAHYATELGLDWLPNPLPSPVRQTMLVSADRDIVATDVHTLRASYGAIAADWESGAIAYVCARNEVRCLILRAVSDTVSPEGGEAYGDPELFAGRAKTIMNALMDILPNWLEPGLVGLR